LLTKSQAVAFSHPGVPSEANPACFDVFDATFHARAAERSPDAAVSFESEAYNAFLRSDQFSGELSAMKKDWMLRMRLDIVSAEQKLRCDVDVVQAHETSGGDPRDRTYAKAKFHVGECEKRRVTMAVSRAGGRTKISKFHLEAIQKFLRQSKQPHSVKSIVTELVM
jgi:hypothetical protein